MEGRGGGAIDVYRKELGEGGRGREKERTDMDRHREREDGRNKVSV